MSSRTPQLQGSEAVPDKALLATVLSYLKNKNLKDTEEALRKELSNHGEDDLESMGPLNFSAVGQSGTEPPHKYEESYTSHHYCAPSTSNLSTTKAVQLAKDSPTTPATYNSAIIPDSNNTLAQMPAIHQANTTAPHKEEEEEEDDGSSDEELMEEVTHLAPLRKMPQLLRIGSLSPPRTTTTTSQLFNTSQNMTKTPLWAQNPIASTTGGNVSLSNGVAPVVVSPPAIPVVVPKAVTPVSSITRPFGVQTMVIQSAPTTTSVVGKSSAAQNLPTSLMYQLGTSPLLAPVLTMFSSGSNTSSMFLKKSFPSTTSSLSVETLLKNPVFSSSSSSSSTITEKAALRQTDLKTAVTKSFIAEPATGQAISFQDHSTTTSSAMSSLSQHPRTLASIPDSELTEQYLEVKAFAEDFKTRRIRLGFTQGAVGKSLAERGYSNFAQSTISRFEQMQLSPSNAATIRVILEKWLLEAESPEPVQCTSSVNLSEMSSRKRKKRAVFAPLTKSTLDDFFIRNPRPNRQDIEDISNKLDLLPEEVRVWFCNKRQKAKPNSFFPSSYECDSSVSTTSSVGAPSPPPPPPPQQPQPLSIFGDVGMARKRRRSPSPKTPFTIEELSKSSNGSGTATSPLNSICASMSPVGLVGSITQSRVLPMLFNANTPFLSNPMNSRVMPQFIIPQRLAQTTA